MPQLESPTFLPAGAAHLAAAGSRCVLAMQVCGERRRGEEQAPGPWHSPARMLGAETSSLWQPGPGPPKVGSGMAGLGGQVDRPSREDDEHLAIRSVKSQAADAPRVGEGCSRPSRQDWGSPRFKRALCLPCPAWRAWSVPRPGVPALCSLPPLWAGNPYWGLQNHRSRCQGASGQAPASMSHTHTYTHTHTHTHTPDSYSHIGTNSQRHIHTQTH